MVYRGMVGVLREGDADTYMDMEEGYSGVGVGGR